jgi:hypothetical protein
VSTRSRALRLTSQILLAIQVLSLGHVLLVRHVTCPKHGDIVHVTHAASPARLDVRRAFAPLGSAEAAQPGSDGTHDHCALCIESNQRFALIPPATQDVGEVSVAVTLVPSSGATSFAHTCLILLSPKNSPPNA